MLKKKILFAVIISLAMVFVMVFTACDNGTGPEPPPPPPPPATGPEQPVINDQSGTKRYITGSTIDPLSVTATVNDGGTLSYQWYTVDTFTNEDGTAIEEETGSTFQPSVSTQGTTYYYVVVTNTKTNPETGEAETLETVSAPIGVIVLTTLPATDAAITVTDTQNQYVRGFGGMSNAFNINPAGVARYMEMADIETMFNPETGLGLKILRIIIFPNPLQEVISGQVEPQMNNAATYLNAVRRVNQYGGYVLASPWTPPAHYKTNDNLLAGGHLKTNMYADYANYLRDFASEMAGYNAPIYAVSIQNEPSLVVGYHGMEWEPSEHRNFLRDWGNFTRSPVPVRGWGAGKEQDYVKVMSAEPHNVGTWYNEAMDLVMANAAAYENLDIAAYHIYGGDGTRSSVTRNGNLNRETWMTEYNINSGEGNYDRDSTWDYVWLFADTIHHVIADNNSSAFVWWYLKRFYGVIGDGSYGTVNGAIMPRGYALSHYAKYATDTVRVNATTTHPGGSSNIRLSAFQRAKTKTTTVEQQVMADEDSYSVVIYDKRTSTGSPTSLRISLPTGFTASKVFGIISDTEKRHAPLEVILNPDGNSADVTLPVNAIISVKFVK